MITVSMPLRRWAICVLGFVALVGVDVSAAAVTQRAPPCSGPSCPPNPRGLTFTPVIGIPGPVVERKPIAVLQNSYPDVFNMYILGLESLQARNEATDTSYYQVSGT